MTARENTSRRGNAPIRRQKSIGACEDGSTLIEMAVTLPLMFTLLFCFMEMCLAFYSRDMISECAREGTRYAMLHGASCPTSASPTCEATATQVNSYVTGLGWPNLAGGTMTVATTYPSGNEAVGSLVQVKVTYVFAIAMAFVPKNSLTMTSTSEAYILQ
jgi:Flp pilus assembly protein TadG